MTWKPTYTKAAGAFLYSIHFSMVTVLSYPVSSVSVHAYTPCKSCNAQHDIAEQEQTFVEQYRCL